MLYQDIQKKLIIETTVILTVLSVFSGCTYFLTSVSEDFVQKKDVLTAQLATTTNEKQSLQDKYSKLQSNYELFEEIQARYASDQLSVSRQFLRKKVNEFKPRYFLNDLSLTMAPTQEMAGGKYRYNTGVIVSSELSVNFDALTDEDIYSLIQAMDKEFSGSVRVTRFSITRERKVTDDSLREIARNGQYSMVKGSMQMGWLGIKSFETAAPPGRNP